MHMGNVQNVKKVKILADLNKEQTDKFQFIARQAKLLDIKLVNSTFKCEDIMFQKDSNPSFSLNDKPEAFQYDEETGFAAVQYCWEATAKVGRKVGAKIKTCYWVVYNLPTDSDTDLAYFFLDRVGRVASYPYFRNHVAQRSWEAGVDFPILPVIST